MEKMMKKIEQLDPGERDKLRKMLKEKSKSSSAEDEDKKLGWMYKEDKPESEEYLLGRKVDRHIDTSHGRQEDLKDFPGALFTVDDDVVARRADIDMQAKMKEDPLYAIKQKEEDAKRRLLENPIKMKQLQQLVKEREEQMKANKKKKKKKEKKKKKSKRHTSDSSDSDNSDDELINKYLAILKQKEGKNAEGKSQGGLMKQTATMSRKRLDSSSDEDKQTHGRRQQRDWKDHRDKHTRNRDVDDHRRERQRGRDRSSDTSEERHHRHREEKSARRSESSDTDRKYGLIVKGKPSGERSPVHRKSRRSRSRSNERSQGPRRRSRSNERSQGPRRRSRSPISRKHHESPPRRKDRPEPKKKLSAEEMERRRAMMQDNARARDAERESNVKRYRSEDQKEKDALSKLKPQDESFVKPMMMKHAASSSVEDRIKRNIYNIQRTSAALDKNFTKH